MPHSSPTTIEDIWESTRNLHAIGTTPETSDPAAARETGRMLMWMCERTFYVLAREHPHRTPDRHELHALADRQVAIFKRTAGLRPEQT